MFFSVLSGGGGSALSPGRVEPLKPLKLCLVHTNNNIQATLSNATSRTILSTVSNVASTLLKLNFVLSTMSKQIEHVQFVSTLLKGRNFTIESFDIVASYGNKVECCFDIVAGVDGDLQIQHCLKRQQRWVQDTGVMRVSSAAVCGYTNTLYRLIKLQRNNSSGSCCRNNCLRRTCRDCISFTD